MGRRSGADLACATTRLTGQAWICLPISRPARLVLGLNDGSLDPFGVSDVDCKGGSGDGPYYVGRVTVIGYDVYGLDHDNNGIGCENS